MRTLVPGLVAGRVIADDEDNDSLTYALVATDTTDTAAVAEAAMFDIDASTGQIRTKAGVTYNYEDITAPQEPAARLLTPATGSAATGATQSW